MPAGCQLVQDCYLSKKLIGCEMLSKYIQMPVCVE